MPAIHPLQDRVAALLASADIHLGGGGDCDPVIHDQRFYSRVLAQGSLGLGETWMDGWWDVPSLDGMLALLLQAQLDERVHGLASVADGLRAWLLNLQVERRSGEVGRRHYDLGNDLYAAMLGQRLVYSCGYWRDAANLDAAQEAKLDLVCRKLRLRPELRLLDIGCGGGLLCEPMSRLGFSVTGVDASERNIGTASTHAAEQGLSIDYRASTAEDLLAAGEAPFDVVLNMEVIEHVADPAAYLRDCARLTAPGGLMIVATLNRTLKALALAKVGAEYVLRWVPAGTHDWRKFLKPDELRGFLDGEPVAVQGPFGVAYDPLSGRWGRSSDCDINYMMTVTRDAA